VRLDIEGKEMGSICVSALLLIAIMLSGCTAELRSQPAPPMATPTAPETTTPAPTPEAVEIDAEALFVEKCSVCHSHTRAAIKTKTRSQWEDTVNRMVTTNGGRARADITDEDAALIVDYLAESYGQ